MSNISSELIEWAQKSTGQHIFNIEQLRKEASTRNYYRLKAEDKSYVVMENTTEAESAARFLYASKILKTAGVKVPEVYAFSENLGFILLEDLGDDVLDGTAPLSDDSLLRMSLQELKKIYDVPQDVLPAQNYDVLLNQTEEFCKVFDYLNIAADDADIISLELFRKELVDHLIAQVYVPCHTDFERRNLIFYKNGIYVIDFQDICMAPIGIDLASLLYEHNFDYKDSEIKALLREHMESAGYEFSENIMKSIYVALAHRSMRIIGTFINYFKDGKLLNRKDDIELFLKRLLMAANKLNLLNNYSFFKKLK